MQSKPENANRLEANAQNIPPSTTCAQPWWRALGYNGISPAALGESTAKSSSIEEANTSTGTNISQSHADVGLDEGADFNKGRTLVSQQLGSDVNGGQEHQNMQHVSSTMPQAVNGFLAPSTQLELVGHSIACAQYPYSDPYVGGVVAAYGPQALVHPHLIGMHHARMPLPLEMTEEPVYVNAKQYRGILRRRQSRAKAESEKKVTKVRKHEKCGSTSGMSSKFQQNGTRRPNKQHGEGPPFTNQWVYEQPYLHESRHQHAMRRARGCGGRFLNTKNADSNNSNPSSSSTAPSTESASPSCLEPLPHANCSRNLDTSGSSQEIKEPFANDNCDADTQSNGNTNSDDCYEQHQCFAMSTFNSLSGERAEEGDCSGQQWGSIAVNRARNRALAIK